MHPSPPPPVARTLARGCAASLALAAGVAYGQPAIVPQLPPIESAAPGETQAQVLRRQNQEYRPLTLIPTLSLEETFTSNVNLQPNDSRKADAVTQVTPGLLIDERSPRTYLKGSIAAPILLYARTGAENNHVVPEVHLDGSVEAVERFFFVDTSVNVAQEFLSPFGPRSVSLANNPNNAYSAQSYTVSPYIKDNGAGLVHYQLRDNNVWSDVGSSPLSNTTSYSNEVVASVSRDPLPLGWAAEFDRADVKFTGQNAQLTEIARFRTIYRADAALQLNGTFGYEHTDYPFTSTSDFVYGAGASWRPTVRTLAEGYWEHRFFGSSYRFVLDHRTPLSVWNVTATRNITSYPQELAQFGAGAIVPLLLDALFASRIPNDAQRAAFVLQFMRERGLPFVLSSPVNLFTQQIYLEENASATVGAIGARNTVFVTAYRVRTTPISGSGIALPAFYDLNSNNTQSGVGVVWTHNVTGTTTFTAGADYLHTVANPPLTARTNQGYARAILSTTLSPRTTVYAGLRYQGLRSTLTASATEIAGYAGVAYSFR